MINPKVVTIGVYGYDEASFFQALLDAQVDLFCDIRQRRAVRGSQYAFVNSLRLQARLAELGIAYLHVKELAPSAEVRQAQSSVDQSQKTAKRQRSELSPAFIAAYTTTCLADFSPSTFLTNLPGTPRVITFFCVERAPEACHRSLVANQFAQELGLEVVHL
jgi:uncharacterized protein (DUF488 family)